MKQQAATKFQNFSLKHLLLICFFTVATALQSVHAKPIDPAPIPNDVIEKLHSRLTFNDLPLVQEINLHRQELTGIIGEIKALKQKQENVNTDNNQEVNKADKKALRASLKAALLGKAHELTVLRDRLSADNANQANMQALIARLNDIVALLNEMASSRLSKDRIAALEQMIQSPEPSASVIPNSPPGGFRHDNPQPIPAKPASDQKPAYALQAPDQPIILAALGENIAATLPALPEATSCGWVAADMADDGRNVKITQEIRDLAKQLDYSPVKIMEWMNKEISFEPYYGALKGGQGVLYSKAGGPTDIASLTIALLRASNIPARYVTGNIAVLDATTQTTSGRIQRWLGTKSYTASETMLNLGRFPGVLSAIDTANNNIGVVFQHVWVEACLPYAHYRGSRLGSGGERWIPLDPSFRNPEYQAGIANSVDINYATYLAKRTNELPVEHYEAQLRSYLSTLTPARTLDEVGYIAKPNAVRFDVLPASLPYKLDTYVNWANSGKPDTAVLPDPHQYRLAIDVKSAADVVLGATTNLYMPEIALNRLTLSFKGANAASQTTLEAWQRDNSSTSGVPTINVTPSIKVEGMERYTSNANTITFASENNKLNLNIYLDEITAINPTADPKINKVEYTNISAANLHALQAYALQGSNRLIAERSAKLLSAVRASTQPNTIPDNIEGEFLHIVGLKWMKYEEDDAKKIGIDAGSSGWSGFSIGLTSTQAKVQYTFDLPFGITRTGYLIDAPGVITKSKNLITGTANLQEFVRSAYQASALESYIWQENAHLDAVSTVRGLQFAKEKGIPVLENVNSANWATQINLLQTLPSLSSSNTNSCASVYSGADLSNIKTNYIDKGYVLKIPQCKINYDEWKGSVFVAEGSASGLSIGMIISGGFNGGYSLPPLTSWVNYTPSVNTGYSYSTPPPVYTPPSVFHTPPPPPAVLSAAINYGITNYTSFAGDPVNLVNGNLYHNERDITIKGRGGFPIVFERSYNSRDAKDGALGFGWTHSLNHYITFSTDNPDGVLTTNDDTDNNVSSIIWTDGTGSQKSIATNSTATTFTTPKGFYFTVSREAGTNRFIISEKNGIKYSFESVTVSAGAIPTNRAKLVSIEDRNGNKLNLNYTGNNLTSVVDGLNRTLTLTYTNNRITQITDWTGRQWQYGYDTNGDLISFKNPRAVAGKQAAVAYAYYNDTDGKYLAHMMKSNTLPRGNGMTFEYFINGRVFRHYPTSQPEVVTTFSYNDFRRETVVTEANGHTKRHFFDRFGNPEKTLEDDGGLVSYTYDCRSTDNSDCPNPYNRLSETDATGLTIQYAYDSAGNQTQTLFPASNAQVLRTDFAANTFGQPRRIQDARGNWKIIRYDAKGNITDEIQLKAGVTPAACSAAECAIPAAANIALWTQRQYDTFGNTSLVKRVRDFSTQVGPTLATNWNDTANGVNGLNAVTFTRTGDKNGDGTLDTADIASQSFDNLGRLKTGINENWYPVSVTQYDEVDRPIKQTDALGRNLENDFDANGNLTEARIFKGGQLLDRTSTTYDIADRPLFTTNHAGATHSFAYNLQGQTTATTNPDGYQINMDYDGQGRLIKAFDTEGLLTVRDYDVAGRLQSLTNPAGISQTYSYYGPAQQGRLKRSTLPAIQAENAGRASEQDYDANGNIIKNRSIGSDNSIREHLSFYDAQNRLIRQVSPIIDTEVVNPIRRQICRVYNNLGDLTELWIGSTTDTTSTSCNFADATLKKQVTYLYDDFGRKLKETDGLNRSWNWT